MAASVMTKMLCAALCALPSLVLAQATLPDPTRPATAVDAAFAAAPVAREVLQSVITAPNRKAAIINGEAIPLGGTFGDSRLLEINEGAVVLQNAEGKRVLTLFPDVMIKSHQTAQKTEVNNSAPVKKAAHKTVKPAVRKEEK